MSRVCIGLGSVFAFLSVALGAFGAHGLEGRLDAKMLSVWETAARYQMYHALALIGFGLWATQSPQTNATPAWAFSAGIALFCGSLYALALSGVRALGMITPLGGLAFMVGWIAFAGLAFKR